MKDDGEGFTLAEADDDDDDDGDDGEGERRQTIFSSLDSNESHLESNFIPTKKQKVGPDFFPPPEIPSRKKKNWVRHKF